MNIWRSDTGFRSTPGAAPGSGRRGIRRARPRCAGTGCRAARRAAGSRVNVPRRLAPDALPSLAQHDQAGCTGWQTTAALSVAGDGGLAVAFALCVNTIYSARLIDELARYSRAALRSVLLPRTALVPDRRPGQPATPEARPPSFAKCSARFDRRAGRLASWHVSHRGAKPRGGYGPLRRSRCVSRAVARRSGRPAESGELEFDLAGTAAHRADDDLDVVAELGHQFQQLGFADAAELAAGDA